MNPLTITIVLLSALMHAGWNALGRRRGSPVTSLRRILLMVSLAGLLPALAGEIWAGPVAPLVWQYLLPSGLCIGVYFYCLARAYGEADFTATYPVARSLPVLLVACGDVALGRAVPTAGWIGMLMVVAGCMCAPLHSFREISLVHYANRANAFVVLAALGTVGFSLLDKSAMGRFTADPVAALRYCYFLYLLAFLVFTLLRRAFPVSEPGADRVGWGVPLAAAVMTFGGYALVVLAYQMADRASYVLAFRQVSILVSVALGFAFFREKGVVTRASGALLMASGLTLVVLMGGEM